MILPSTLLLETQTTIASQSSTQATVPIISASTMQYVTGTPTSKFGENIINIGNYFGNGTQDFLIAGRQYGDWQGKAWIYFTGPTGLTSKNANFTITGEPNQGGSGLCFGHSVANVGDVNGDNITDFVVGGPGSWYSGPGSWDVGKVYLFYGNTTAYPSNSISADQIFVSPIKYDWFGETVVAVKDFNGDGIPDLAVGAPGNPTGGSPNFGSVYIFFGNGQGFSPVPNLILRDNNNDTGFGLSLSAGDLNGDGLTDIVVGAQHANNNQGAAYIFYGRKQSINVTDKLITPDVTIKVPSDASDFGSKVAVINSINNNNYNDVLVQYTESVGVQNKVAFYLGSQSSTYQQPDAVLASKSDTDQFGFSMLSLGDINHDGYNDFAIGAYGSTDTTQGYQGYVYIYYGGKTIPTSPGLIYKGENPGDGFGYSMGTITIKGTTQLLISSIFYKTDVGRVYLTSTNYTSAGKLENAPSKSTPGYTFAFWSLAIVLLYFMKKRKLKN